MISKNSFYSSHSHANSPTQIIKEEKNNHVNSEYLNKAFSYQDIANSLHEAHNNRNEHFIDAHRKKSNFVSNNSNQVTFHIIKHIMKENCSNSFDLHYSH